MKAPVPICFGHLQHYGFLVVVFFFFFLPHRFFGYKKSQETHSGWRTPAAHYNSIYTISEFIAGVFHHLLKPEHLLTHQGCPK